MPASVPNTAEGPSPSVAARAPYAEPPTQLTTTAPSAPTGVAASAPTKARLPDEATGVLSTLNDDGSRRWITPRPSPGRFLSARRLVAWALIALFTLLPHVRVHGQPLILLDLAARRFHILGGTFYPTDTLLLALLGVGVFLTIFWLTALFGRVWCGWACPQTVYMEFLYRPIERLFEGTPGRARRGWLQTSGLGKVLKFVAYAAASLLLAHTFLSYFVGWDQLRRWVFGSPLDHPVGFGVVALVTGAMMFDFSYFREQVCLVACPYGRFQSVLLDRHSLCVRYDAGRGEPRGRKKAQRGTGFRPVAPASSRSLAGSAPAFSLPQLATPGSESRATQGDCIDCRMCVTTCPTGIDIRNGLQMECVNCTQCIDACDAVMEKIGRPRGLVRYASEADLSGERFRLLRPRTALYPAAILLVASIFVLVLVTTGAAEVTVLRGLGRPFTQLPSGEVENNVRVKIVNRENDEAEFTITLEGVPGARLVSEIGHPRVAPGSSVTVPAQIFAPAGAFKAGRAPATVTVHGPRGFTAVRPYTVLGPANPTTPPAPAAPTSN